MANTSRLPVPALLVAVLLVLFPAPADATLVQVAGTGSIVATSLTLVTCNVRRDLSPARVRLTVSRCVTGRPGARPDVILWQEIETRAHRRALRALSGYVTLWPGGAANAVPISYSSDTMRPVTAVRAIRAHRGRAGITPHRYVVSVVLRDRAGTLWPVLNTHMLSGPFGRHPERRPLWNQHAAVLRVRCNSLVARYGFALGGGDFNRSHWTPCGIGFWSVRPTFGRRYTDGLYANGAGLVAGPARRIKNPSDHYAVGTTFTKHQRVTTTKTGP